MWRLAGEDEGQAQRDRPGAVGILPGYANEDDVVNTTGDVLIPLVRW